MSNELQVVKQSQLQQLDFSQDKIQLIKETVAVGATDLELQFFIEQCKRTQLDPVTRQIYFIKDNKGKVNIQTSIDGLRLIASRSNEYEGQTKAEWCGSDGVWRDIWLDEKKTPSAARVGVYKKGFREALYAVALYSEYAQMKDEWVNDKKTGKKIPNYIWGEKPALMLSKVAEALALRKSFPNDMSEIYTTDEYTPEVPTQSKAVSSIVSNIKPIENKKINSDYDQTYFEQATSNTPEVETIIDEQNNVPNPDYVCQAGKKHLGQTLAQIGVQNVKSYGEYLLNNSRETGKELTGKFMEFVLEGEKFIAPEIYKLK